jgi:hypothetical protein
MKAGETMNGILWIAQILLAGVFLFAGFNKILVYERHKSMPGDGSGSGCIGLPNGLAAAIALLEIAGALGVVTPVELWPSGNLLLMAATGLALLTLGACVYHARRKEPTAQIIAVFLLALFVIVGRWPS